MEENRQKLTKRVVKEILMQNQEFRKLLDDWPAREVMMDFEKEWNEKRLHALKKFRTYDPRDFDI